MKSFNNSMQRSALATAGWLFAAMLASGCFLRNDLSWHLPGANEAHDKDAPDSKKAKPLNEAEALRELARTVDAADDPRFTTAVRSPSAEVRIEALRAWAVGTRGTPSAPIIELKNDNDPRVRAEALRMMAARKHPEALDGLTAALHDVDLNVRLAAVGSLGELDSAPSRAALADLLKDRAELVRAEAVVATAAHGAEAAVLAAASDTSWRVRLKVAEALAGYRDAEAASAARRMLDDPSAEVERQVVRSLASWPMETAAPVLLDALGRDAVSVRRLAAEQFATRWPTTTRFPYDGPPARRAAALAELRARYEAEYGRLSTLIPVSSQARKPDVQTASDERVEQLVNAGDVAALANLGPDVVDSLERLTAQRRTTLPDAVYRDVLPACSPAFAALDRMARGKVVERQQAADELLALARKQPLGDLAIARLCALMTTETDAAVWCSALDAVASDGREPAVRMAHMALGQSAGEVRRRACECLAAHPDSSHETFLLPLLTDAEQGVVLAAIRALGAAGRMANCGSLRKLLASADEEVQLEAAVALVRLRDPSGEDALRRLSYSGDIRTRGRLAQALGELGDARFTAILIRFLDDSKATVSHAALASLPRIAGRDTAQTDDGKTLSFNEQVARWKKWYETAR